MCDYLFGVFNRIMDIYGLFFNSMIKKRVNISINDLIKLSGRRKSSIAKEMGITPQWLSTLLSKHPDDLTVGQLKQICTALDLQLTVSVDIKIN